MIQPKMPTHHHGIIAPLSCMTPQVVVKVQRPGLKQLFDIDLENLKLLAEQLDKGDENRDFKVRTRGDKLCLVCVYRCVCKGVRVCLCVCVCACACVFSRFGMSSLCLRWHTSFGVLWCVCLLVPRMFVFGAPHQALRQPPTKGNPQLVLYAAARNSTNAAQSHPCGLCSTP
jgi:hypothetical protein